jgi:hypothetical protein
LKTGFLPLFAGQRTATLFKTAHLVKNLLSNPKKVLSEKSEFCKNFHFSRFFVTVLKLRLHLVIARRNIWLIGLIAHNARENLDAVFAERGFLFTLV